MDSLLSIVQMPAGVPVATLAIGRGRRRQRGAVRRSASWRSTDERVARGARRPRSARRRPIGARRPGPPPRIRRVDRRRRHPRRRPARADARPRRPPARLALRVPRPRPTRRRGDVGDLHRGRLRRPDGARRAGRAGATSSPTSSRTSRPAPLDAPGRDRARLPVAAGPLETPGPARREDVLRRGRHPGAAVRAPSATADDVRAAMAELGSPVIAEDARARLRRQGAGVVRRGHRRGRCRGARWAGPTLVLEGRVPFDRELSVIAVRGRDGRSSPTRWSRTTTSTGSSASRWRRRPGSTTGCRRRPRRYAADSWTPRLRGRARPSSCSKSATSSLANEIAPRCTTRATGRSRAPRSSQFENHLRACLGLPLGATGPVGSSVMVNVLGDLPDVAAVTAIPGAHLHLYGKAPRPAARSGTSLSVATSPSGGTASRAGSHRSPAPCPHSGTRRAPSESAAVRSSGRQRYCRRRCRCGSACPAS